MLSSVTITNVISATATTIVSVIETDTTDATATLTDDVIIGQTSTATLTVTVSDPFDLDARDVTTATPSHIPAYASACSGSVRYSSACSCLGLAARTVTASQPTTTSTVTQAVTPSINTIYSDVATVQVTSTVATVTETTTYSTEVITTTVNSVIVTELATSVTTETVVATLVVGPSPTPTFYLQATYPASDAGNANVFGYNTAQNGEAYFINFQTNVANAVQFSLDPDTGYVQALNGPAASDMAFYSTGVGASSFVLVTTSSYSASQGGQSLICSIDPVSSSLDCNFGSQTAAWWLCGGHLNVVQPGYDFTNKCSGGTAEQISVSVVPVN